MKGDTTWFLERRNDLIISAIYHTSSLEAIYSQNKEALNTVTEHNVNIKNKGDLLVESCKLKAEKFAERPKMESR